MASAALARIAARTASALALLALLAGVPWLLATAAGWPLPDHLPTLDELSAMLTSPPGEHVYADAAALAGWTTWTLFTAHVIAELLAWRGNGTRSPDAGGGGPLRAVAALLVAGILAWPTPALTAPAVALPPAAAVLAVDTPSPLTAAAGVTAHPDLRPTEPAPTTIATSGRHASIRFVIKGQRYHAIVAKGDTLSKIAKRWLGDADRWPELCRLNLHRHWQKVGGTLHDCDLIYPNWDLRLPDDATPPPGAVQIRPAAPRPVGPALHTTPAVPAPTTRPAPAPTASAGPTVPPSLRPATPTATASTAATSQAPAVPAQPTRSASPTISIPADPDGVINEPAPQTTTTWPTPATSNTPDNPDHGAYAPSGDDTQVQLPSGSLLPAATALGLLAAAVRVWIRRRRRYQPSLHTDIHAGSVDADLRPLPALIATLKTWAARRRKTPGEDRYVGVDELLQPDDAEGDRAPGGTGLTGPGAHSAARAALITALSAGSDVDPDQQAGIVIPATTLATLLGADALDIGPTDRLRITADLNEALTVVQTQVLARSRDLYEYDAADLDQLRAEHSASVPLPPLLLIADAPDAESRQARLLYPVLTVAAAVDTSALMLGDWPTGTTWHTGEDGTAHPAGEPDGDTRQLPVLDVAATIDALQLLHEAHTGRPNQATARPVGVDGTTSSTELDNPVDNSVEIVKAQVNVLGKVRVGPVRDDGPHFRSKAAEMLAYLAVHPDGAHAETIADALYPGTRRKQGAVSLHQCASNLRRVIAHARGANDKQDAVPRTADSYRLRADLVDVDWWQFVTLYKQAAATADSAQRIALLRRACAMADGRLASDHDSDWITAFAETVRRRTVDVHTQLAELILEPEPSAVVELLTTALEHDPYDEHLYRLLMRAYHSLGDVNAVNATVRRCQQALKDLDVDSPTEETLQLAGQLRTRRPQR